MADCESNSQFGGEQGKDAVHGPHVVPEEYYKQYLGKPGVKEGTAKFLGIVENIDTNLGVLLRKIEEWGIAQNTLMIYFTGDNGGTADTKIFNAGLHGGKGTPYQGGTRAVAFFRWPGGDIPAGAECDALSEHIDIFPTLAELTGAKLPEEVKSHVEGCGLLPLLKNPKAEWPDRILVHHVGRWRNGQAGESKFSQCAIHNSRFTLVNNKELYDLKADPGETKNVIDAHPELVAKLRAAHDQWWNDVQSLLVNENVVGPKVNPFKDLYWKQFGGEPDAKLLKRMNRQETSTADASAENGRNERRKKQGGAVTTTPR